MRQEIIEAAIEQAIFEIAKCENEMSWHFEHERQHWIFERIMFFLDNQDWLLDRGF